MSCLMGDMWKSGARTYLTREFASVQQATGGESDETANMLIGLRSAKGGIFRVRKIPAGKRGG